jgi:hypothetical protein
MIKKSLLIIDLHKQKNISGTVLKNLKEKKIIIFRNLFKKDEIIKELDLFKKKKFKLTKKSGDYFVGKKNFSRFDKNNKNLSGYARLQYFHTLFTWNKDESFRKIFKKVIKFRNKLYNIKSYKNNIFKFKNDNYFNLPKVNYLPARGHLGSHIDLSDKQERNFVVIMSKIDRDFSKGGFFIIKNKKLLNIEKDLEIGDIICNDVNTYHGVEKIFCNKNQIGRYSLVLSMRKVAGSF